MCLNLQACLWEKSGSLCSMTKNKGAAFIDLPSFLFCFPSFLLSLLSPLLLRLLKKHNKNTISNLKHSPCVKLDWKPLLKEITFAAEFLFLQSASGANEVRKALWPVPTAEAGSLRECASIQYSDGETETFTGVNPSVDGQGYIPSLQVQRLGCLPASRDPF